ncbi:OLC1v1001283C1 [Oldenlandia corymbosa var. corymbosa]|uniref:OLC1v1001283C1 n=1 Tax=Oldenlandia corymbosa var. corymbosa TaxID=529605 RepID=A0AAV1D7H5_OLDCO|nr:OLC1v1001283C1 [Oldenlandia corymbosa var. corymbosa]
MHSFENEVCLSFVCRSSTATVNRQGEEFEAPMLKLPDAAFLLSSPALASNVAATDHSSRVAAAMAESVSRKRDLNISSSSYTRHKLPKGNLPHSKRIPDTTGGNLLPPQLAGRSNVVTEDISKLFVKKRVDSSSST